MEECKRTKRSPQKLSLLLTAESCMFLYRKAQGSVLESWRVSHGSQKLLETIPKDDGKDGCFSKVIKDETSFSFQFLYNQHNIHTFGKQQDSGRYFPALFSAH